MRIWDILGIEPTNDVKDIKRAYSKQLKIYHPEDDAEGYQRLREAYDLAIKLAKRNGENDAAKTLKDAGYDQHGEDNGAETAPSNPVIPIINDINQFTSESDNKLENSSHSDNDVEEEYRIPANIRNRFYMEWDNEPDPESQLKALLEQLDAVYSDFRSRIDKERWMELLNADIVWKASMKQRVSSELLHFLEEHYLLPHEIWELLNGTFFWLEHEEERDEALSDRFPHVYARISAAPSNLNSNYSFLLKAGEIDYDAYLQYREAAHAALANNDLTQAEQLLGQASALYSDDLQLILMQIECYRRMGDHARRLASCNDRISADPNALDGYYSRALALYDIDRPADALKDLKLLIHLNPNNREALFLSGRCYMKLGETDRAKEMFTRILNVNRDDVHATMALMKVKAQEAEDMKRGGKADKTGRSEALSKLNRELGRLSFSANAMQSLRSFISRAWLTLILSVILSMMTVNIIKDIPEVVSEPFSENWFIWLFIIVLFVFPVRLVYRSLWREIRRSWRVFRYNS